MSHLSPAGHRRCRSPFVGLGPPAPTAVPEPGWPRLRLRADPGRRRPLRAPGRQRTPSAAGQRGSGATLLPVMANAADITTLLAAYRQGEPAAFERLLPLVYDDLRRIARRQLRDSGGKTLDATALVHEAYLKMAEQTRLDARDRGHFLAICARAMRQFLVGYARQRHAGKRGGPLLRAVDLDAVALPVEAQADQLVLIDQALEQLAAIGPRMVKVFECRYFAGLSEQETADALDMPLRSVQREWMRARAWLRELLLPGAPVVGS